MAFKIALSTNRQPSIPSEKRSCAICSEVAKKICSICKNAYYCDQACQRKDWPAHKRVCIQKEPREVKKNPEESIFFHTLLSSVKSTIAFTSEFAETRAFITTNDSEQVKVLSALQQTDGEGELFVGSSCLASLDFASVQPKVKYILVIDVAKSTRVFWEHVTPIIKGATDRHDCLKKIKRDLEKNYESYCPPDPHFRAQSNEFAPIIVQLLKLPTSWLSDDGRFNKIKTIFTKNHFVFLHLDLADSAASRLIRTHLDRLNLKTHTIYLSNIIECIPAKDLDNYGKSLEYLTDKTSLVIDSIETPFITTKEISSVYAHANLKEFVLFHMLYGDLPDDHQNTMRLRERNGQAMENMYPLVRVQRICRNPNHLFYSYGIIQGYYTKQDEETLSKKVRDAVKNSKKKLTMTEILKLTMSHIKKPSTKE